MYPLSKILEFCLGIHFTNQLGKVYVLNKKKLCVLRVYVLNKKDYVFSVSMC